MQTAKIAISLEDSVYFDNEKCEQIALGFNNFSVSTSDQVLLSNVSGFVNKGCITAGL
jgi:hypothetical protein